MSVADLIDYGYVKAYSIRNLDVEVEEDEDDE